MTNWTSVLARLGMPTGDNRILVPGGITNRDLPLPLSWQRVSAEGHMQSVVVGRIESIDYAPDMVTATGSMLDVPEAAEAQKLIEAGVIGPSVDLDDTSYVIGENDMMVITQARVAGATLVSIPAFADVSINLTEGEPAEALAEFAESLTAAASVPLPPFDWFANPQLPMPTPLTVTDEGRVFGHIAPWDVCYIGLPGCTTAPSSPSGYAYFLTHEQVTDGGTIPVGVLSVGGGHAAPEMGFMPAKQHYDDVSTAVARVNVGEDAFGIWAAGWVIPSASPQLVDTLRSAPLSGDWRRIGGSLELVAACSVNTPGFPIPRARVQASMSLGKPSSLVMTLGRPVLKVLTEESNNSSDQDFSQYREKSKAQWAWSNRKGR